MTPIVLDVLDSRVVSSRVSDSAVLSATKVQAIFSKSPFYLSPLFWLYKRTLTLLGNAGLLLLSGALFLPSIATADTELPMHLQIGKLVTTETGQTEFVPVSSADVGDTVQYRAIYQNPLDLPMHNVVVTLPIPYQMTFTGEAYPLSAQGSRDGVNYADVPLYRDANGQLVPVPFDEYRSLRWNIKLLPAHRSVMVSLNVVVQEMP